MSTKSVNMVVLLGNLGKDPELKYTPSGTPVVKFSLATNERFKGNDGQWQDRPEWHNLVAWQRTAEVCAEYLKKGSKIYVKGRLQTSSWVDKQTGDKKWRTEIIVEDMVMLDGRNGHTSQEPEPGFDTPTPPAKPAATGPVTPGSPITDEDVPF